MHTHFLFSIFSIFLFFYFFGLGPTQPTWAGLDPASPARSLAQASDPVGPSQQEACVDWLHACIMHSAKVINLPSHRATSHSKWMYKNESKMAYLFFRDGGDGGSAVPFVCSQPSLLLSFASVPAVPFLFLFFPAFSVLVMKHWGWCWLVLSNLGLGFVLCLCWCSFIPHSLYPLSLVFFLLAPLCCFSVSFFSGPLCLFSLRPLVFSCLSQPLGSVIPSPLALSHLLWLYSQRMPNISTIETASKPLLQKPFLWKETKKAMLISRNGAVCVMGMAIYNLVTEVLKSCNQAPG